MGVTGIHGGRAKRGRERHPEVAWSEIIGMQTMLVQRYFEIDTDIVWTVVERDVPTLKTWLEQQGLDTS
jgi:uncharacterized protein with HEPN domain